MLKRYVFILLIIIFVGITLFSACNSKSSNIFELTNISSSSIEKIDKIVIWRYGGSLEGQTKEITDKDIIKKVIDNFKSVKLEYDKESEEPEGGKHIHYTFYSGDKKLNSFEFENDAVRVGTKIYKIQSGEFDKELLESIEPKKAT